MTFQYFLFDTYPGFFLQALPFALIVGVICGIIRYHKDVDIQKGKLIGSVLFVCYFTGLICLVLAKDVIAKFWYDLLYHMSDGGNVIRMFAWDCNVIPDFWTHLDGEKIGNFIMFLPFGILYPFYKEAAYFGKTLLAGIICIVAIECLQPVFGRAFDINDIIMNFSGVLISAAIFSLLQKAIKKKNDEPSTK